MLLQNEESVAEGRGSCYAAAWWGKDHCFTAIYYLRAGKYKLFVASLCRQRLCVCSRYPVPLLHTHPTTPSTTQIFLIFDQRKAGY